jgi:hypothetical protein
MTDKDINDLRKKVFLYKIGVSIWKYKNSEFIPSEYIDTLR